MPRVGNPNRIWGGGVENADSNLRLKLNRHLFCVLRIRVSPL